MLYQTVEWLKKEMTHPGGGFYSALDADSEGVEGKFYTWAYDEVKQILGEEGERLLSYYQATDAGNWDHGRNIFRRDSATHDSDESEELKLLKHKLLIARRNRIRPALDDKILTGWNAMNSWTY